MKISGLIPVVAAALCLSLPSVKAAPDLNVLSEREAAAGWKLLFDGKSLSKWRADKGGEATWRVEDGAAIVSGKGGIVTKEEFGDCQLHVEWATPAEWMARYQRGDLLVAPPTRDEFTEVGVNTSLSYGFPGGKWQSHLRAEYVSGTAETDSPERWRISPAVSWIPAAELPMRFAVQYNYDHSPSFGDEHSIWAQVTISWGDCCSHPH